MITEQRPTRSESTSLDQFCRALRQPAQKNAVETGLAEIAALCQRLFAGTGATGDEGDWSVRQEVEPLLRHTRLILTSAAGTLWIYLDRQAQPWAGVWFEPKMETLGFNLETDAAGCQFCFAQGLTPQRLTLSRTVTELGWTVNPDQGTADDWSGLSGNPDVVSPAWLFDSETPATPPPSPSASADARASSHPAQPSAPLFNPPSPISPVGAICTNCGAAIKAGKKFCGKCGTPAAQ